MSIPSISLLIFIFYSLLLTTSYADIELGSTLRPTNQNNNWNSPNKSFSLGFIPVPSTTPSLFAVAISFSSIPIWKAGGDSGVVDSNSRFEFLGNGNLRLVNGTGGVVWQSNTANRGVTVATLDDSGNLSLKNGSTTVWSTFDNPTDTILAGQNFTINKTLRSGSYSFNLLKSGNLTLTWNPNTIYWNQGLNSSINPNLTSPSLGFLPSGILQLNDLTLRSPIAIAYSSDLGDGVNVFRFLRLDSDGNLRIYRSVVGSGNSTERWAAVQDQCLVYGWCGNLGICSYNETNPICSCPSRNFEFVDPNDSRKGCKRKLEISNCSGNPTMLQLDNTRFLTYQPELSTQQLTLGLLACRSTCQVDSACIASTVLADGFGMCQIKRTNFVSGYHSPALPSTSYVKLCGALDPNPPPPFALTMTPSGRTSKLHGWVVAVVVLVTLLVGVMLEGILWLLCCRNNTRFGGLSAQYALLEYASGAPIQFSYKELQRSTKGFKEKLGSGGFGSVYRGILVNRTVVAVKQLEGIEQGEKQFRMEVATISSTHHLNLVRLVGFCTEGRHRLLVYEFMKNGSLDNFLFTVEETSGKLLNWETRFNIALGTAKGVTYLHEECRDCIVHCDIKPENILLDENYNAKVSDFGLSKLINSKDHRYRTLTSVRGTRGYLAPEWVANLPITSKSDIYSYGMVLLEIVSGRRNFEVSEETCWKKFSTWAYEEFERGNVFRIVDKRFAEHDVDMEQVMRAVQISFWCIQEQPSQRPTMGKVVQMLEGITIIERPPVPNSMTEGSVSGTSMIVRDNIVAISTAAVAASAPDPSSASSSFRVSRGVRSF